MNVDGGSVQVSIMVIGVAMEASRERKAERAVMCSSVFVFGETLIFFVGQESQRFVTDQM